MKSLDKYLNIKSVMGIVFAPVVTVAALSISLIFMTALVNGFQSTSNRAEIQQTFWTQEITPITTGNDAISFNGVAQMEFTKLPRWEAMDRFSRLMVNFFAIGLMRMIFFAALKANTLGEKIGGGIQSFWSNVFKTLPILPIGEGGKWVGIGSAAKVISNVPERFVNQLETTQQTQVKEWLYPETAAGITAPAALTTLWTAGNIDLMYEAINKAYEKDQKTKEVAIWRAEVMLGAGWYDKETQDRAKEKIDILTTNAKDEATLRKIINDANNKADMEAYFTAGEKTKITTYTTPLIDKTTFDITKKTDWTYDTTPTTNPPANTTETPK